MFLYGQFSRLPLKFKKHIKPLGLKNLKNYSNTHTTCNYAFKHTLTNNRYRGSKLRDKSSHNPLSKTEYCNNDMKENNEKGEFKKTIRIFKMMAMENIMRDFNSVKYAIIAYLGLDKLKDAEHAKDIALSWNIKESCIYNPLIQYHFEHQNEETALSLFQEMKDNDIAPDGETISILISHYYRIKQYDKAEELFYNYKDNVLGELPLFNSILPVLIAVEKYDEADKIYDIMKQKIPIYNISYTSTSSYAILHILGRRKDLKGISIFLDELVEMNIIVRDEHYIIPLKALHNVKAFDEMFSFLDTLSDCKEKKGYDVHVFNVHRMLMLYFADNMDIKNAEELFNKYKELYLSNDDFEIHLLLATVYLKSNLESKALQIFRMYAGSVAKIPKAVMRQFFDHFAFTHNVPIAEEILNLIRPSISTRHESLLYKFKILCCKGKINSAREVFRDVYKNVKLPSINLYNILFDALNYTGRYREAEELFMELLELGLKPNLKTYELLFYCLMKGRGYKGIEYAVEKCRADPKFEITTAMHNYTLQAMIKDGMTSEALKYLKETEFPKNEETASIILSILPRDYSSKDLLETTWEIVSKNDYKLKTEDYITFIDLLNYFNMYERSNILYKYMIDILDKSSETLSMQFCHDLRSMMIDSRLLTQASPNWSYFLKFERKSNMTLREYEKEEFLKEMKILYED